MVSGSSDSVERGGMKRAFRLFLVFALAYSRCQDLSCFYQTRCRERRICVAPVKRLDSIVTGLKDVVLMNWRVGVHARGCELATNVSKIGTGEPRLLDSSSPCVPILPSSELTLAISSHCIPSHQPIHLMIHSCCRLVYFARATAMHP